MAGEGGEMKEIEETVEWREEVRTRRVERGE